MGPECDLREMYGARENADVIIVDECQFLTPEQIDQLRWLVDRENLPVLCFGLRTDFQTKLFPGSRRLFELSKGKRTCTVIISDHTRPVPSRDILPVILSELRQGNSNIEITLLVATGLHRQTTADELRYKLGDSIFGRERIAVHDCDDKENMVYLGQLPSGSPLYVNRIAAEADLLVSEGFIEPHFFAGFSGGRKSWRRRWARKPSTAITPARAVAARFPIR